MFWPVLACLLLALPGQAFVLNSNSSGQTRHWPSPDSPVVVSTNVIDPATKAIRYFMRGDAYSKTNAAAELNAIRASFDQWQSVPGTSLKFEEAELLASAVDVNTSDHTNAVFWAKSSTLVNGGLDDISGAFSVTFPRVTADNVILEADIVLNGVDFRWFTDFSSTEQADQFIESTVLHEIGHFIGLDHSPVGGATMLARGLAGVNTQAGLSSDEVAAARTLYPVIEQLGRLGSFRGRVSSDGIGVFGASVMAEDSAGNVASGTVTATNGQYELPALAPGIYRVRVSPLDPPSSNPLTRLLSGGDIGPAFANAETGFLPANNPPISIAAGETKVVDLTVAKGAQAFRVTRLRPARRENDELVAINSPATIRLGESNLVVGVCSPDFPANGAVLKISGDGLTLGPSRFTANAFPNSNPVLNLISVSISVARNAAPGLRSLVVEHGTNIAYANGFLEILPAFPDYNFDGLDDTFQRRYFSLFTAAAAAPKADPDGDGFENGSEHAAGTDPTNRLSLLRIERVTLTLSGCAIVWQSVAGKRYQLFSRSEFPNGSWQPVGAPVTAAGATTQALDATATNSWRFYRVLVLP